MSQKLILPAVLLAHDLRSGRALYWTADGWSQEFANPIIATEDGQAGDLHEIAERELKNNHVADAALEEVIISEDGTVDFKHYRERIIKNGPSVKYGEDNPTTYVKKGA